MEQNSKIFVAGHRGMVGSAIIRCLKAGGYTNLVVRTHQELDLTNQKSVANFFDFEKPEYVFLAAAKVGGIFANNRYPADFIYANLQIQNNVIHHSYTNGVKKLLFLGSSCVYPKNCPQPMREEYLLSGPLERTNEPYAIAKIAGIKMCQSYNRQYGTNFIAVMPTNLYGPNDNFDSMNSHVFASFVRKFYEAKKENKKEIVLWGTGKPRREFLHVDDMAHGCVFAMNNFNPNTDQNEIGDIFLNLGTGIDVTIKELAELFRKSIDFKGRLEWDVSKPDGSLQKLQDVRRMHEMGWTHTIDLSEGVQLSLKFYESLHK